VVSLSLLAFARAQGGVINVLTTCLRPSPRRLLSRSRLRREVDGYENSRCREPKDIYLSKGASLLPGCRDVQKVYLTCPMTRQAGWRTILQSGFEPLLRPETRSAWLWQLVERFSGLLTSIEVTMCRLSINFGNDRIALCAMPRRSGKKQKPGRGRSVRSQFQATIDHVSHLHNSRNCI
jgi:hypothetical protein